MSCNHEWVEFEIKRDDIHYCQAKYCKHCDEIEYLEDLKPLLEWENGKITEKKEM